MKHIINSLTVDQPYQGRFHQIEALSDYQETQDWYSADARNMDIKAQSFSALIKRMLKEQIAVFVASGVAILVCQAVLLQSLLK